MTFDANAFLEQTYAEANDTKVIPVPVGEYTAVVESYEAKTWISKNDPSKSGVTLNVTWELDSPEVKALLDRDKVSVRQGIMLDLTDAGGLDMGRGRNVGLGRLREALNLNVPGQPFSFTQLVGGAAKVSVSHRIVDDNVYAEVKAVARL